MEKTLAKRGITLAEKRRWSICARWAGRNKGWRAAGAGIDSKTLAVANDNDFGVKVAMQNPVEGKLS